MIEIDKNYNETESHIYFWNSYLSNFASCLKLLEIDLERKMPTYLNKEGIRLGDHISRDWFYTSEQLYMTFKAFYFEDFESVKKILATNLPLEAKQLGRAVKNYDESLWEEVRLSIMVKACYIKFSQNEVLMQALLSTGEKTLVEASPYDKVWGVGLGEDDPKILDEANWKGLNLLGIALMKVRTLLKLNTFEKWKYIDEHPDYGDMGAFITVIPQMVDPLTKTVSDDISKNTELNWWLELSYWKEEPCEDLLSTELVSYHDVFLDSSGVTMDEAVETLFDLLIEHRGDY